MDLGEDSMASDGGDVGVPPFGSVPADYVQFFYARSHFRLPQNKHANFSKNEEF